MRVKVNSAVNAILVRKGLDNLRFSLTRLKGRFNVQVFTGTQRFGLFVQLLESETTKMRFTPFLVVSVCVAFQANAAVGNDSPLLFDRFSHIRCMEEIARLDNYARALKEVPNTTGGPGLAGAFELHFFTQQLSHRDAQDARGLAHKLD